MTEPGSQVSSEGRNVPNLVLQEEERSGSVAIWHAHQREKQICFEFFFILSCFSRELDSLKLKSIKN